VIFFDHNQFSLPHVYLKFTCCLPIAYLKFTFCLPLAYLPVTWWSYFLDTSLIFPLLFSYLTGKQKVSQVLRRYKGKITGVVYRGKEKVPTKHPFSGLCSKAASSHPLVTAVPRSQVLRKFAKEPKGNLEGVTKNLRTKMGKNTAHTRNTLCLCDTMLFTTISSTVVLTSSRTRSRIVRELCTFTWENPEESRRSVEQIFDQSATRSGAGWEKVPSWTQYGLICVSIIL
jgi:hypothetical protein